MNNIGFPGLGIEPFTINSVAFTVPIFGGLTIAWYGIIVTLSILAGIFYAFWRAKKSEDISSDDMMDVAIFSIPAAIVGARVYYIIFNLSHFGTFGSLFNTRQGGLAIYGGLIFALAACFGVCKFKKLPALKVFDAVAPAIMLGQIIGRWGNFTNAEAFGTATELPWRMFIGGVGYVHPTFLYESLWNLVGFIAISLLYKYKKFDGLIFLIYISWYGLGRMLIEGLRVDSLMLGNFRVSQVFGGLCLVGGLTLIILLASKAKIKTLENDASYVGAYSTAIEKISDAGEITVKSEDASEESDADEKVDEPEAAGEGKAAE